MNSQLYQSAIFKYQLNIYSMNHQYDFQEQLISQRIPVILVPNITPQIASSRGSISLNGETLKNIEMYLMESKRQQKLKIDQIKAKQQFIGDQINKQQLKKQQKIKCLEQMQKQKMFKECTFKPATNTKGQKRGLNQFLQNQNAFTKKVMQKRETLKKNLQQSKEKQTYRPKVNTNLNKKRNTQIPIHQRLYALKDKENVVDNKQQMQNNSFKPNITQKSKKMMRNGPIQDLLYGDALRRQQKAKDMTNVQNMNAKTDRPVNLNNEKYAAQKFIRQYFSVLQELSVSSSIHYKIQYIMFNEILKATGFIQIQESCDSSVSTYQRSLVHDAYQIIQKFTVNARNVCVFLLAIIGIYHINPVNFQQGQQSVPQKQFHLDQVDGRKLQKHFDTFFRNRLNSQNNRRNPQVAQKFSFQPKINKKSQQLAQKFRNHMLQQANQLLQNYPQLQYSIPQDGIISHTDLLVLNKMAKNIQNNKKRQQTLDKGLEECTFKPTTLSSMQTLNNSKVSLNDGNLGSKKSLELYNYYKNLQSKKQSLRISRQVEDGECTFIPNTNKEKVQPSTHYAKQIDETLYRMHKGRQYHEQKKSFLQRGQKNRKFEPNIKGDSTNNQRSRCSMDEDYDDQIPTLILDVNLGNKMDRITLYKKDQNKLAQVARSFSIKHELDEQSEAKLLQSLEIELNNVLDKIQEDQESEDMEH